MQNSVCVPMFILSEVRIYNYHQALKRVHNTIYFGA